MSRVAVRQGSAQPRGAGRQATTVARGSAGQVPLRQPPVPYGNRAVLRMLGRSSPDRDADRGMPAAVGSALRTAGTPLPGHVRARAARQFALRAGAAGLRDVRVHADAAAAEAARSVRARAVTVGQHIFFGTGEYQPHTDRGDRLIAHELAHVMQPVTAAGHLVSQPGDAAEREADRAADAAPGGAPVRVGATASAVLQRQPRPSGAAPSYAEALAEEASPLLASALGSVTLDGFATGKSELSAGHRQKLLAAVKAITLLLRTYTLSTVRVIGHTDTVGVEARNLLLGLARAEAVAKAMVDLGLPEAMVATESLGESPPQAQVTGNEVPSARNRRVEVVFHPRKTSMKLMTGQLSPPSPIPTPQKQPNLFPVRVPVPRDAPDLPPDFFAPIPPLPKGSGPKSGLDVIGEPLDRVIDTLAGRLPKKARDWLKEKARDGVKAGAAAAVRAAAESAGLTDETALDALEKAAEAAIQEKGQRDRR